MTIIAEDTNGDELTLMLAVTIAPAGLADAARAVAAGYMQSIGCDSAGMLPRRLSANGQEPAEYVACFMDAYDDQVAAMREWIAGRGEPWTNGGDFGFSDPLGADMRVVSTEKGQLSTDEIKAAWLAERGLIEVA